MTKQSAPAPRTWRERLRALGIVTFESKARGQNPFDFLLRVLGLTVVEASIDLDCLPDALELLVRGEADEVIDEVRRGLRQQGLDDALVSAWYLEYLEAERARMGWA